MTGCEGLRLSYACKLTTADSSVIYTYFVLIVHTYLVISELTVYKIRGSVYDADTAVSIVV